MPTVPTVAAVIATPTSGYVTAGGGTTTFTVATTAIDQLLLIAVETTGSTAPPTISMSAPGITLFRQSGVSGPFSANGYSRTELWWAYCPTIFSGTVTLVISGLGTFNTWAVATAVVTGANNSTPWDPNVTLPAYSTAPSGQAMLSYISTSVPVTYLLFIVGTAADYYGTPYASQVLVQKNSNGGTGQAYIQLFGNGETSQLTNSEQGWTPNSISSSAGSIINAILAAGESPTTATDMLAFC